MIGSGHPYKERPPPALSTFLDATVGVDPVVDQQHQPTEGGRVEREGRLQPPQLFSAAPVPPVFAEVEDIGSDQPQVVHRLKLGPCSKGSVVLSQSMENLISPPQSKCSSKCVNKLEM